MGFYPGCPGNQEYVIGLLLFKKVTLQLQNGKGFTIEAATNDEQNIYPQSVILNNRPLDKKYINHSEIIKGCVLTLDCMNEQITNEVFK